MFIDLQSLEEIIYLMEPWSLATLKEEKGWNFIPLGVVEMFFSWMDLPKLLYVGFVLKTETKEEEETSQSQSKGLQKTDLYHLQKVRSLPLPPSRVPDAPVCSWWALLRCFCFHFKIRAKNKAEFETHLWIEHPVYPIAIFILLVEIWNLLTHRGRSCSDSLREKEN